MMQAFDPGNNQTIAQANATGSAGGSLPESAASVVLYNSSATATAYFVCIAAPGSDDVPTAVVPSDGTKGSLPVPPGQSYCVTVPRGPKKYATIASAEDGTLFITPGLGL